MSIANTTLEEAKIIDIATEAFTDKPYAFVAVRKDKGQGWQLAVAVANESGYNPIPRKTFSDEITARRFARKLNEHIGRDENSELRIITSTMGGAQVDTIKRQ